MQKNVDNRSELVCVPAGMGYFNTWKYVAVVGRTM